MVPIPPRRPPRERPAPARVARPWLALAALLALIGTGAAARAEPGGSPSLIVKLHSEGPHAVTECAERLSHRGEPFARATADRSDSLDRLHRSLGVRSMQALFRRPDGRAFEGQRRALHQRLARAASERARRPGPAPEPPDLAHVYRVELAAGSDPRAAAARFRADPHVVWAQPNYAVVSDRLLDDPLLRSQGSWGQAYPDQWGVYAIEAPEAWDTALGAGVVVAVVDTGVDLAHPDLAPNLWVNPGEDLDGDGAVGAEDRNGIDDDGNGFVDDLQGWDFQGDGTRGDDGLPVGDADPQDENGHGTHVAGIAAARGDNGIAIAGVAPFATVMPVRVFPPLGSAETAVVWQGVLYAALNGADVINGSFSCGAVCRSNPIAEEVLAFASQLGVAFVTSAGNLALDVMLKSPERLRESIVVGSLDPPAGAALSSFSSFGWLVDVVAPGRDVLSLAASVAPEHYGARRFVGDLAMRLDGTSMSAPHVSGLLALLLANDPTLTPEELRAVLRASATDLGAPGHDRRLGAGRVSAAAALRAGRPPDLRGRIDVPLPGDTVDGESAALAILGAVEGADVADARLELGAGDEPQVWTPLPLLAAPPFAPREMAHLPIAALPDGAYVLRLTLTASDGRAAQEFAPISLDRNRPVLVSSAAHEAQTPDLSGERIVWQSPRPVDGAGDPELDLFEGVFGVEGEHALVTDPGDQRDAAVSERALAWREPGAPGTLESVVRACPLAGRGGSCRPLDVGAGAGLRGVPRVSRDRVVFDEVISGASAIRACRVTGRVCRGGLLAPEVPGSRAPVVDGHRVVWTSFVASRGLLTCLLGPGDTCTPAPLPAADPLLEPIALSGPWLATIGLSPHDFALALLACRIDLADSRCDASEIATFPFELPPAADLSGARLVWHGVGAHGQPDVYFCELGVDGAGCTPQAITRDAASQTWPRIDGARVVWVDDREGVPRVASFELPTLVAPDERELREGELLSVPVRVAGPPLPVAFSVREPTRGDAGALGVRLEPQGDTRARLLWRPGAGAAGRYAFVLRATRTGGLYTEAVLRVEVLPAGP